MGYIKLTDEDAAALLDVLLDTAERSATIALGAVNNARALTRAERMPDEDDGSGSEIPDGGPEYPTEDTGEAG